MIVVNNHDLTKYAATAPGLLKEQHSSQIGRPRAVATVESKVNEVRPRAVELFMRDRQRSLLTLLFALICQTLHRPAESC